MLIQPKPPIIVNLRYIAEVNIVEINFQAGMLPQFSLGMKPDAFFAFCDSAVDVFQPFIEKLKELIESGEFKDIKVEFDKKLWNKLMGEEDDRRTDTETEEPE